MPDADGGGSRRVDVKVLQETHVQDEAAVFKRCTIKVFKLKDSVPHTEYGIAMKNILEGKIRVIEK